nr:hypothetical protein [Cypionkella sp.]
MLCLPVTLRQCREQRTGELGHLISRLLVGQPFLRLDPSISRIHTSIISDCLDRIPGCVGLMPFYHGRRMVGPALTVRTRAGDNLSIHQELDVARPGHIIVVDGAGYTSRALVAEIMKAIAESRGVKGFVIDGAIRDVDAFRRSDFPCFARVASMLGLTDVHHGGNLSYR